MKTRAHKIGSAWLLGFQDGFMEPYCLTSGYTWDEGRDADAMNEMYDMGATFGQAIARLLLGIPLSQAER